MRYSQDNTSEMFINIPFIFAGSKNNAAPYIFQVAMRATVFRNLNQPKPFWGTIGDQATAKSHPWVMALACSSRK